MKRSNTKIVEGDGSRKELTRYIKTVFKTKYLLSGLKPSELADIHQDDVDYCRLRDDCAPVLVREKEIDLWSDAQNQKPPKNDPQLEYQLSDIPDGPPCHLMPLTSLDPLTGEHPACIAASVEQFTRMADHRIQQGEADIAIGHQMKVWIQWMVAHRLLKDKTILDWLKKNIAPRSKPPPIAR